MTTTRLPDKLQQKLSRKNFLVIGRAGMDFYPDPPGTRNEEAASFVAHLGGSSANICVALTKLGAQSALLTRVSDDSVGRFCLNQLDRYGVDRRFVTPIGGQYRNSLAVSESRIEDPQTVIYRNGAADFQMSKQDVEAPDYSDYGALITTGTVLAAEPSRAAALHAFSLARSADVPLVFDVDYRPYSWASAEEASNVYTQAAQLCDIIIGNDVEFGFMAGAYEDGLHKARELSRSGASLVVYKMGEKGAITLIDGEEITTGIYPAKALKPTGAGDSFMGGLIASLADNHTIRESLLRGSACASMVVARVGCAPAMPTTEELNRYLASHPGPTLN